MKELDSVPKYHLTNRPDHIAQLVERRASNSEVVGSNLNVVGLNFQPAQCGLLRVALYIGTPCKVNIFVFSPKLVPVEKETEVVLRYRSDAVVELLLLLYFFT